MSEPINIQDMIDGRLDIKSLGEAANGDENTQVVTRTGQTYPSAKKAINNGITKLFENGGLPATPFATKALMTASALTDGKYAMVTDDTVAANNGLYVKTAGAWVKSAYDVLALAKEDATTKANNAKTQAIADSKDYTSAEVGNFKKEIGETIRISSNDDLLELVDSSGHVYAKFDTAGDLHLTGIENTVQDSIQKINKDLYDNKALVEDKISDNIIEIKDSAESVVAKIDKNGELYIPNLNTSVQASIKASGNTYVDHVNPSKKVFFSNETNSYVMNLTASGMGFAPIPISTMPSSYTVSNTIVDSVQFAQTGKHIVLDTPYRKNDMLVHPYIVEVYGQVRGYRYIMCITPMTSDPEENPVIYGSNDLENFEMLTGFEQPLDTPHHATGLSYLSDNGFAYDPLRGEIVCFYRSSLQTDSDLVSSLWCRTTKDLLHWTPKKQIFEESSRVVDALISPAILFDPVTHKWRMWSLGGANKYLYHRTASSLDGEWSAPEIVNVKGRMPGHLEVRYIGGKFAIFYNMYGSGELHMGISSDGIDFTFSQISLLASPMEGLYKPSLMPAFDANDSLYFNAMLTQNYKALSGEWVRKLYHLKSNSITI